MNHFHNTIDDIGDHLDRHNRRASTQERQVMTFFRSRPMQLFTPLEVLDALNMPERKITSIRRAITNLSDAKIYGSPTPLLKTEIKRMERYGVPNYTWRLNPEFVKGIQLKLM